MGISAQNSQFLSAFPQSVFVHRGGKVGDIVSNLIAIAVRSQLEMHDKIGETALIAVFQNHFQIQVLTLWQVF